MNCWLVGTGYWGSKIKDALIELEHTVSVIDVKNGNSIDDINTMDPVILATPVWEHFKQASILIKKGHDVYIEKPAAETGEEVKQLLSLVDNEIVMVGHIFIHNPAIDIVKKLIDSDKLGKIRFVHSERTNLGIYQTKTSTLLSLAPHDFSIIDHLLGPIFVDSAIGYHLSDNEHFDRVSIFGNKGDPAWQIDVSWRCPIRRRIVTVYGEYGQAVWNEDRKEITVSYNNVVDNRLVLGNTETIKLDTEQEPLVIELAHFFDCVKSRQTPKTNLADALRVATEIDRANSYLQIDL